VRVIDISRRIEPGMALYPGDPPLAMELALSRARGDLADVTRLELGTHTGTHVDAPAHFLDGGAGVDALPLDALIGPAVVADAGAPAGALGAAAVASLDIPEDAARVLLKGAPEEGLDGDAARLLVRRGVRLVGVDCLSVGDADAHRALLEAGVVIVEGLHLAGAAPGPWRLVCLPLLIPGADGAPARAVLEPSARDPAPRPG
jgi:arylformamidase